jgi:hypothetical protein
MFGPVNDALSGHCLADDDEFGFRDVLRRRGREFYIVIGREVIVGKSVMMTETLWRNYLVTAKYIRVIHRILMFLQLRFLRKNWRHCYRTASGTAWKLLNK